jgi:hypothetical protein
VVVFRSEKESASKNVRDTFKLENLQTGTALSNYVFSFVNYCPFLWQLRNSTLNSKQQNVHLFTNSLLWFWRMSLLMLHVLPLRRMERAQLYDVSPVSYKCTICLVCTASEFYGVLFRQPHFRRLFSRSFLFLEPIF